MKNRTYPFALSLLLVVACAPISGVDRAAAFSTCQYAATLFDGLPGGSLSTRSPGLLKLTPETPEEVAAHEARERRRAELQRRENELRNAAVASGDADLDQAARSVSNLRDLQSEILGICMDKGF